MTRLKQVTTFNKLANGAPLYSDYFNGIFSANYNDIKNITEVINAELYKISNDLKTDWVDANFDGANIFMDKTASLGDYGGLFYSEGVGPATISEVVLSLIEVLAYIDNGLREGTAIGSSPSDTVTILDTENETYTWGYSDKMFDAKLFYVEGGTTVKDAVVEGKVTVDIGTTSSVIKVTNISGGSIDIWGNIWHPVFNF